jgi:hypothetical protein
LTFIVRATVSRILRVSGKCRPVSRNTTSTPGETRENRCATTASAIELVTQKRSPKVLVAQRAISSAGAPSRATPAASANAFNSTGSRRVGSTGALRDTSPRPAAVTTVIGSLPWRAVR